MEISEAAEALERLAMEIRVNDPRCVSMFTQTRDLVACTITASDGPVVVTANGVYVAARRVIGSGGFRVQVASRRGGTHV